MRMILVCFMFYLAHANANIEYSTEDAAAPSATEVRKSRACFEELARNGCEDPGGNFRVFRSCLHDVFPKLSPGCQKMTSDLYRRRN